MAPSADRVRDYQERMRLLEAQALQDAQAAAGAPLAAPPVMYQEPQAPAPKDPIVAERRRREYDSLFASNVVLSRRPENERPDIGRPSEAAALPRTDPANPSVEEVADAVVRATTRVSGLTTGAATPQVQPFAATQQPSAQPRASEAPRTPRSTGPISPAGPLHRVLEGTPHLCGHNKARVYHVHNVKLYDAIGQRDARFRKRSTLARAIERLMILDHIIAHRDLTWLGAEQDKVAHFLTTTSLRQEELPRLAFGNQSVAYPYTSTRNTVGLRSSINCRYTLLRSTGYACTPSAPAPMATSTATSVRCSRSTRSMPVFLLSM
jgi:hypothetical protein